MKEAGATTGFFPQEAHRRGRPPASDDDVQEELEFEFEFELDELFELEFDELFELEFDELFDELFELELEELFDEELELEFEELLELWFEELFDEELELEFDELFEFEPPSRQGPERRSVEMIRLPETVSFERAPRLPLKSPEMILPHSPVRFSPSAAVADGTKRDVVARNTALQNAVMVFMVYVSFAVIRCDRLRKGERPCSDFIPKKVCRCGRDC